MAKKYLHQTDVPGRSLDEALLIPKAIADNYALSPTAPIKVAKAMDMAPKSTTFRMLCGASMAYGLTDGGAHAQEIKPLTIAKRILKPTAEGDDVSARREALLTPRVVGEFLRKYNGSPLPKDDIAQNVLVDMGVPEDKSSEALEMILSGARSVGFLTLIKGKEYVDLTGEEVPEDAVPDEAADTPTDQTDEMEQPAPARLESQQDLEDRKRKVFIAHGKNKGLIEPIRKLLKFGELEAVVSTQKQTVSQPVSDKVIADMRTSGAAIIHVDAEETLIDKEAKEHHVLNTNVLIEIGAAMALYGRRFILLVKEDTQLPSNLQGLFEVRYEGKTLDGDATIRLLEAINDIKNHPLPGETSE